MLNSQPMRIEHQELGIAQIFFWIWVFERQPLKTKWSLQLRSLDPALSERFKTLPVSKQQLEGATSSRILLPTTPAGDWFRPVGSSFLTNEQSF
jgi:hypothetical protein